MGCLQLVHAVCSGWRLLQSAADQPLVCLQIAGGIAGWWVGDYMLSRLGDGMRECSVEPDLVQSLFMTYKVMVRYSVCVGVVGVGRVQVYIVCM